MTDINFYVGKQQSLDGRLAIACVLVNKALEHKLRVHIHTDQPTTSQKLDTLLWTHNEQSFLPHALVDTQTKPHPLDKITISHEFEPLQHCDYLINLSNQRPSFFSRFKKMAEIIDKTEEILTAGRKRYAFYRDRGYTLEYHQL